MMENFNVSEKYRKYLIELQFESLNVYTVWGTDMKDDEIDKLLVKKDKLIAYKNIDVVTKSLKEVRHPFLDSENFNNWVIEEGFRKVYNVNDFRLLSNFSLHMLIDRSIYLEILNCINLVQDFFTQIEDGALDSFFETRSIIDLKDFIYNNYFWKKEDTSIKFEDLNGPVVVRQVKELYNVFFKHIQIM
ncbi:MAG: hypothetical protein P0Y49_04950 [Candidatus Pedobacter colombiensis]|uniref:Uncharacterized protein n=1 Tax=Candidatus Pedobacter colombiensis TaxID=3121371 RepID=A0AAJ5W9N5_9SPHI|nr:hypothetical protein [Pedobacter sp.]WEK20484.1 MAG: hypothetical protein P0Y49_04950 [Pedobacter sp.]